MGCADSFEEGLIKNDTGMTIKFTEEESQFLEKAYQDRTVSLQEALHESSVFSLGKDMTRSNDGEARIDYLVKGELSWLPDSIADVLPDTLAYIITTTTGRSTIVSADRRVTPNVIGQMGVDELYPDDYDEPANNTRDFILDKIACYFYSQIVEFEVKKDSIQQEILAKINTGDGTRARVPDEGSIFDYDIEIQYTDESPWDTVVIVNPMLPVSWHQDYPYNYIVRNYWGCESAPTGCGPTAIAQIMAFWKYPSTISAWNQNWSFDWDLMTSTPTVDENNYSQMIDVAMLMSVIGENAGTTYGCENSSTSPTALMNWLFSIGYQGTLNSYSKEKVINSLNNGCPVFIYGYSLNPNGKHGWVIDGYGYLRRSKHAWIITTNLQTHERTIQDGGIVYETVYYMNNCWGMKNIYSFHVDSWLPAGCFDCYYNTTFSASNEDMHVLFSYDQNVKIYTNIRPTNQ